MCFEIHVLFGGVMKRDRTKLLGKNPIIPDVCAGPGEPDLVSVIIPTYNRGYFISKTIDSVLAQTYRPIEIIVVDDGSNDDTREVVGKYGSQVRYIHQENAGLASARNTGLAAARGEYIAFQDSDDIWLPWKLQAQVALMRQVPNLALAWTDMTAVDPDGEMVREKHLSKMYTVYQRINIEKHLPVSGLVKDFWPDCPSELRGVTFRHGDIFASMFLGNLVHPPTALIRRRHIHQAGGLDITFAWTCEDYEFFWRVSRYGNGALIEAPSMLYRVDAADQLTKPHLILYIARGNLIALQRKFRDCLGHANLPHERMKLHLADAHEWVALEELKSQGGCRFKALRHFLSSIRLSPFKKRAYFQALSRFVMPKAVIPVLQTVKRNLRSLNLGLLLSFPLGQVFIDVLVDFCMESEASLSYSLAIYDMAPVLLGCV